MAGDYDIADAFKAIEDELIASMMRNMKRHRAEETALGYNWSMWQVEQLRGLEKYKQQNYKKYSSQFADMNKQINELIRESRISGGMEQEKKILQAIRKGYKVRGKNFSPSHEALTSEFFRLNDKKLNALIKATVSDMKKAETAILRMANDQYRKIIFNAQVYANTGAGTYEKAVDMATKDMLASGLNCVEYKNGARHTLSDYADMAIRTASKRAYLQGEGEKRQEWGISTVIMNKRGNPCSKCLPWVGKVLIDDVWSGGSKSDGEYPLMSTAIASGLYHPRCQDSHTTYFEGISNPPDDKFTKKEIRQIEQENKQEAEHQNAIRQAEKYERLEKNALDSDNRKMYGAKAKEWRMRASSDVVYQNTPVYYDNNADYAVHLSEFDEVTNRGLSEAAESVAIKGSKDRNEHMHLVNLKSGKIEYYETNGMPDSVGTDFWKYAESHPETDFAFVHNHNIISSLSETDLITPVIYQNVPMQIAVQNDGVMYIAKRTGASNPTFYPDLEFEEQLKTLNKLSRDGKITPIERMQEREKIIIDNILEKYYPEGVTVINGKSN